MLLGSLLSAAQPIWRRVRDPSRVARNREFGTMREAPSIADVETKRAALGRNKRLATGLLLVAVALAVGTALLPDRPFAVQLINAAAEAAIVGGLADWFAVTALFRRPMGLPIPHTALIVERKDQFAATLGRFVQENFLNADVLAERIGSARLVPRLAAWLADEANAARFAGHAADLAVKVAEALRDEDVQRVLTAELTRVVD